MSQAKPTADVEPGEILDRLNVLRGEFGKEKSRLEEEFRATEEGATDEAYLHGKWQGVRWALEEVEAIQGEFLEGT